MTGDAGEPDPRPSGPPDDSPRGGFAEVMTGEPVPDGGDAEPSDDTPDGAGDGRDFVDAGPSDDGDGQTHSPESRWWLTNDLMAIILGLSLVGVVTAHGAELLNLQTLPQWLVAVYSFSVGVAVTWAFGSGAVKAWRNGK